MVEYIDWFKRCKGAKRKIQGWEVEVIEFVCLGGWGIYIPFSKQGASVWSNRKKCCSGKVEKVRARIYNFTRNINSISSLPKSYDVALTFKCLLLGKFFH